ncbi:NlpC/P60 family protein [Oceanicella actignis]|uniref:Putative phage cell wall peptidase, NlpC/P60 family n=1 Tax=Oceanicella actignis TaxID=1189325 RepID=A0A1M7TZX8_9RHOB|nr:NlpC/P60 family protein [Oceanicella actignis]TYO85041.1 NlpC/P60 family putative phage cell wall peptidase [Oceanicella actignis]SET83680.1 putative phage cell wall peptidase, NlpC/P60 family [Oceanicella actignis]SHN76255.1 putative phage cell wall peptidase, NlpC/P60 family [Oceanicella actignis]
MTADPCFVDARAAAIVAAARGWLGTPYRHQASLRGAGADCLGLVRGVWREVIGPEPEAPPPYSPDWSEPSRDERLWRAAARHMTPLAPEEARAGDVLLFRMRRTAPAKHLGILTCMGGEGEPRMIHAYSGRGVVESSLGPSWRRRIAAAFRFPR